MGYETDPGEFVRPYPSRQSGRVAAWTWRPVGQPALTLQQARAREWELARYRSYQAELAGRAIGDTFRQAADFIRLACHGVLSQP
jgi:hypothetical protein